MSTDRDAERDDLEARADRTRSDLLRTVGALDDRRKQLVEAPVRAGRDPRLWSAIGWLAAGTAGLGAVLWMERRAHARRRRRRARWRLLGDLWPRARRAERGSMLEEAGRSIAVSLLTAAVTVPLKRAVAGALEDERKP